MPTSTAKLDTVVHHWDEDHSGYRNPTVIESLIIDNVIQLTPALVGTASEHCMHYYNTVPVVKWHYQMGSGVRPSVFLSVNRVPRPNSRTERPRKPKSGRIEVIKVIKLSRLSGHLMLRPKVRHILNFRTGGLQFQLCTQTEHENPITDKCHDLQGQRSRSQGQMRMTGGDQ